MVDVKKNLSLVVNSLPEKVRLVAVSKYHSPESILQAYEAGQRVFGESHEQELRNKHSLLPQDIEWHFIGHLQTNKVKYIAPYISLVEAVDSMRLLREIDRQAERCARVIDVLLELHIAQEETKYGLSPQQLIDLLEEDEWRKLSHVRICGLMTMASNVDDDQQIAREFDAANKLFLTIKERFFASDDHFCCRSWGMSDDYKIAIDHGSNMVRIGTSIFGERTY